MDVRGEPDKLPAEELSMDAEHEFIKRFEFEKRIELIMSEYYNFFGCRLTVDKYKKMIKDYYAEEGEDASCNCNIVRGDLD